MITTSACCFSPKGSYYFGSCWNMVVSCLPSDTTYTEPIGEINKLVKQKIMNIERKFSWVEKFKVRLLITWLKFHMLKSIGASQRESFWLQSIDILVLQNIQRTKNTLYKQELQDFLVSSADRALAANPRFDPQCQPVGWLFLPSRIYCGFVLSLRSQSRFPAPVQTAHFKTVLRHKLCLYVSHYVGTTCM